MIFEDYEIEEIEALKKNSTWHNFILELVRRITCPEKKDFGYYIKKFDITKAGVDKFKSDHPDHDIRGIMNYYQGALAKEGVRQHLKMEPDEVFSIICTKEKIVL